MKKFKTVMTESLLEVAANEMFMLSFSPDLPITNSILIQPYLPEIKNFAIPKREDFQKSKFLVEY